MPNTACSRPSGNGGLIERRVTKCRSGTASGSARPGRASSAVGMPAFFLNEKSAIGTSSGRGIAPAGSLYT